MALVARTRQTISEYGLSRPFLQVVGSIFVGTPVRSVWSLNAYGPTGRSLVFPHFLTFAYRNIFYRSDELTANASTLGPRLAVPFRGRAWGIPQSPPVTFTGRGQEDAISFTIERSFAFVASNTRGDRGATQARAGAHVSMSPARQASAHVHTSSMAVPQDSPPSTELPAWRHPHTSTLPAWSVEISGTMPQLLGTLAPTPSTTSRTRQPTKGGAHRGRCTRGGHFPRHAEDAVSTSQPRASEPSEAVSPTVQTARICPSPGKEKSLSRHFRSEPRHFARQTSAASHRKYILLTN